MYIHDFDSTSTEPRAGSQTKCTKPSPICSEMHWQRNCHLVIAAKESHAKDSKSKYSKDKSDKVHVTFSRATVDQDGQVLKVFPKDEDDSSLSEVTLHLSKRAKGLSTDEILLDNQASVSVFGNTNLLSNILAADQTCQISGISSQDVPILATKIGDYYGFEGIYACLEATANV